LWRKSSYPVIGFIICLLREEKENEKAKEEQRIKDSIEREKKLKQVIKTNALNNKARDIDDGPLTGASILSPVLGLLEIVN